MLSGRRLFDFRFPDFLSLGFRSPVFPIMLAHVQVELMDKLKLVARAVQICKMLEQWYVALPVVEEFEGWWCAWQQGLELFVELLVPILVE